MRSSPTTTASPTARAAPPPPCATRPTGRCSNPNSTARILVALGRLGHETNPNVRRRRRLVLSGAVPGLEPRPDAWWWNPERFPWRDAAARLLPHGGRVAVPGGQGVFDLFLATGYDAFHLTRAHGVRLEAGRRLFSACDAGASAEAVLAAAGLRPDAAVAIDAAAGVVLTIWRR